MRALLEESMATNNARFDWIRHLVLIVERAGGSVDELLAMSGLERIPVVGVGERMKQETDAIVMIQSAIELTKNPALALHLGRRVDIASLGSFGFAVMSCAYISDCIRLMSRYQKTLGAGPSWQVFNQYDGIVIRTTVTLGSAEQRRIVSELLFAQFCATTGFLISGPLEGAELRLGYPAPRHASEYQRLLAIPVRFDQPHSQLRLPKTLLNSPVRTANPAGQVVFLQQCEELLRSHNQVENTSAAVRRLLVQSAGNFPSICQVAQRLNVSERTLRRRLDGEANSFRAIKEEVKNMLAQNYLANTELTVAEVATLLDYTETVNFRQAFVRWNGVTPTDYRRQQLTQNIS
jgi:AraC-like DNA-binding protein